MTSTTKKVAFLSKSLGKSRHLLEGREEISRDTGSTPQKLS
jgi:hypothetical protein